jgi:ATP-binding cassette, subfamily B, bacterial
MRTVGLAIGPQRDRHRSGRRPTAAEGKNLMGTRRYSDLTLVRRIILEARPFWLLIFVIFLLDLLKGSVVLLGPLPLKIAIDSVIGNNPLPGFLQAVVPDAVENGKTAVLFLAAALLMLIRLLSKLQSLATSMLTLWTGEKLVLSFQARLFRHAQRLSLSYHDAKGTADATYRIKNDAPAVKYIAIDGVSPFVTAAITLVTMLYITIRLDWQLALIPLSISPVLFIVARIYRRRMRRQSHTVKETESTSFSVIQEVLTSLRVVKAFGQEDRENDRLVRSTQESIRARLRMMLSGSGFSIVTGLATSFGTAAVLVVGVRHVMDGSLLLGDLTLMLGYIAQLYSPLKTMTNKGTSLQSHLASAERAFALLDHAPDVPERPDARPLDRATGAIVFRGVSFAYGDDPPVLRNISFVVPPGTRVGIAGTTGAGKTTLVSLLTRFFDPTSGEILLDGTDLRDYRLVDLRNQFAIVLQESVLFSTTIADNIAYARPGAEMSEIIDAARAANAHDFINALPEGYRTKVGERGMRLSGGERQRIALARAFLKRAPVLILDEPTSSVDVTTEESILEAMERLMRGCTAFMIAHRLTTLRNCDMILRIEQGQLVEIAKPQQLPALVDAGD